MRRDISPWLYILAYGFRRARKSRVGRNKPRVYQLSRSHVDQHTEFRRDHWYILGETRLYPLKYTEEIWVNKPTTRNKDVPISLLYSCSARGPRMERHL